MHGLISKGSLKLDFLGSCWFCPLEVRLGALYLCVCSKPAVLLFWQIVAMANSHSEDDCPSGSVAFTETCHPGLMNTFSSSRSPVLVWPCSSLCWNLFLPLFMLIHSNKSKWEWVRSLVTSCTGLKFWVTPLLLTPIHTHAHMYVLLFLWHTQCGSLLRLTYLNGQISQQSYLVYSFMLSELSYWKSIAACCGVKPAT